MKIKNIINIKILYSLLWEWVSILTTNSQAQAVYDALFISGYYNHPITAVNEILNLVVKFIVGNGWGNYVSERLLIMQANNLGQTGFTYSNIAVGQNPDEAILASIKLVSLSTFPEEMEVLFDPSVKISNSHWFHIGDGGLYTLSIFKLDRLWSSY